MLTFALEPDTGAHVYACGGWFRAGASYLTPSTAQFLPGAADHALTLDGASFGVARRGAPVGAASVVPGIPFHVRPHADGFRLLMRAGTLVRLYDMSLEGTLSELGDYAGASGYAVRGCRVDSRRISVENRFETDKARLRSARALATRCCDLPPPMRCDVAAAEFHQVSGP